MSELERLKKRVAELEKEVAALKAAPNEVHHHHYQQPTFQPAYPLPSIPAPWWSHPIVTCSGTAQ